LTGASCGIKVNHMVQYAQRLDAAFGAVSDATRRGILERLARDDASIGQLAEAFGMSLTGVRKHVQVLEDAGLVRTEKVGRVRHCMLGPRHLEEASGWIAGYRRLLEARLARLDDFLERTQGSEP
jgi:DNA-binding transcriptional ArsR family regulator